MKINIFKLNYYFKEICIGEYILKNMPILLNYKTNIQKKN